MSERGWCPLAVARPSQTFGYPQGAEGQNRPVVFVDHVIAGYKRVLDDLDWQLRAGVGVTFGLGRDGSASQYRSIFDAHWGNGIAGASSPTDRRGIERYDRSNRHLAALEQEGSWEVGFASWGGYWWLRNPSGGSLLNMRSIATEHEDFPFDAMGAPRPWTPAMLEKDIAIKRWCIEELAREGMPMVVDADVLVGHYQIDGVNRPNCPGPAYPRAQILAGLMGSSTLVKEETDMEFLATWTEGVASKTFVVAPAVGKRYVDDQVELNLLASVLGPPKLYTRQAIESLPDAVTAADIAGLVKKLDALKVGAVDVPALAKALAADPTFIPAIVKAVNDNAAARLKE